MIFHLSSIPKFSLIYLVRLLSEDEIIIYPDYDIADFMKSSKENILFVSVYIKLRTVFNF